MSESPDDAGATGPRPRDLALVLLAADSAPPRARARDQQADLAGGVLRRRVLDQLAEIDPEPEVLEATLAGLIAAHDGPEGPVRAICSSIRDEWATATSGAAPALWSWLLAEAVTSSRSDGSRPRKRRREGADRDAG